jgi:hypothetical protein
MKFELHFTTIITINSEWIEDSSTRANTLTTIKNKQKPHLRWCRQRLFDITPITKATKAKVEM